MTKNSKWKVSVALLVVFTFLLAGFLYRGHQKSAGTSDYTEADLKRIYQYPDLESSVAALKRNPKDAAAYRGLASYYSIKLDSAKAIANWRKAVELEPDNDHNWLYLGFTLQSYKQHTQAAEAFRRVRPSSKEAPDAKEMLDRMKLRGQIP